MSSGLPKCYVASPYGFAEGTKYWYDQVFLPAVSVYVEVLDPWSVDVTHILEAPAAAKPELWLRLGERHLQTIEAADMVVALLDQEPPDNGTVVEVAWAAAHGKSVIGYRNDVREGGEIGLPYNLMIGAAIARSGGTTVSSLAELQNELTDRSKNQDT